MKNAYALAIAAALAVAGLLCNFAYLNMRASDEKKIAFIGIAPVDSTGRERVIPAGQKLRKEDLVPVEIPARSAGNLKDFAFLYSSLEGVVNYPAKHELRGGRLLLRGDIGTPPDRLDLREGEVAMGVPINMSQFVPALAVPGNYVWFAVPRSMVPVPTPAAGAEGSDFQDTLQPAGISPSVNPAGAAAVDMIGPFRILSLGNRLARTEIWRGVQAPTVQENVLMIAVKMNGGQLEPKAQKLLSILATSGGRGLDVLLDPKQEPTPGT